MLLILTLFLKQFLKPVSVLFSNKYFFWFKNKNFLIKKTANVISFILLPIVLTSTLIIYGATSLTVSEVDTALNFTHEDLSKLAYWWARDLTYTLFRGDISDVNGKPLAMWKLIKIMKLKLEYFHQTFQVISPAITGETSPIYTHYSKLYPSFSVKMQQDFDQLIQNFNVHLRTLYLCMCQEQYDNKDVALFFTTSCHVFLEFTYIKTLIFVIETLSAKYNLYSDSELYSELKKFINEFSVFMKNVPKIPSKSAK